MGIHDLFEILRPTNSESKNNKPRERKYDYDDGENVPKTRKEYKKIEDEEQEQ